MNSLFALSTVLLLTAFAVAGDKPVVFISGEGNIEINSDGIASAGPFAGGYMGAGFGSTRINKHNQTMEMAQRFLRHCPELQITVDEAIVPDYYVALNREGGFLNLTGQSQIMTLDRRKTVIFVAKKGSVKSAVRSTCEAIASDWQSKGRLPIPSATPPQAAPASAASVDQPRVGGSLCGTWFNCAEHSTPPTAPIPREPLDRPVPSFVTANNPVNHYSDFTVSSGHQLGPAALELHATARAQTRCKAETLIEIMSDLKAYLNSRGIPVGKLGDAAFTIVVIVDRPESSFGVTVQARDRANNLLWSDRIIDAGSKLGGKATLKLLDRIHDIIDVRFAVQTAPSLSLESK